MAEEFQTGICGGNWWNSSRNSIMGGSSPCSTTLNGMGSFGWPSDVVNLKGRYREDTNSASDSSIVFQDVQKTQQADSASGGSSVLIDSTLQMMGFGLSSSTTSYWNQVLHRGSGKAENNFHSRPEEDLSSKLNYQQEKGMDLSQIQKDWSPKSFSGRCDNSAIDAYKQISQDFSINQQHLNSITSSGNCIATCEGLSADFPLGSAAYGYPSTLIQSLFEPDPQQQQSLFNNGSTNNFESIATYGTNSSELSPSWPNFSPFLRPSSPKHLSINTPFWNASEVPLSDIRATFLPSSQPQFLTPAFEEKPNCPNLTTKRNTEEVRDSGSIVKKSICEPAFKRPRIETPSPLPTFKVRKEKLGDRITALQQLVSPFGKTDTASVLHEAIDYIKFLHDQVSVLTTPYMKNGALIQHQQNSDKFKDTEGHKQHLRSRGLCLVPISSTFPVANETTADFWTPTFGGTFR